MGVGRARLGYGQKNRGGDWGSEMEDRDGSQEWKARMRGGGVILMATPRGWLFQHNQ